MANSQGCWEFCPATAGRLEVPHPSVIYEGIQVDIGQQGVRQHASQRVHYHPLTLQEPGC